MTRNLEARLDGSTPGESRLSKSAHPWEAETPGMREAVPGTAPGRVAVSLRPSGFAAEIGSCDIADFVFARLRISRRNEKRQSRCTTIPVDDPSRRTRQTKIPTSRRKLVLRTSGASVLNSQTQVRLHSCFR